MQIDPKNPFDKAALDHTSIKVKSRKPPEGKIVFSKPNGIMQMNIVNSPIGYPPDKRQDFAEMIMVLQAEGTLAESGSIGIKQLEAM